MNRSSSRAHRGRNASKARVAKLHAEVLEDRLLLTGTPIGFDPTLFSQPTTYVDQYFVPGAGNAESAGQALGQPPVGVGGAGGQTGGSSSGSLDTYFTSMLGQPANPPPAAPGDGSGSTQGTGSLFPEDETLLPQASASPDSAYHGSGVASAEFADLGAPRIVSGGGATPDLTTQPALPAELASVTLPEASPSSDAPGGAAPPPSSPQNTGGGSSSGAGASGTGPSAPVAQSGASASTPTSTFTSGNYRRHYKQTGRNSYAEYYLEVTVQGTFGSAITVGANDPTPAEQVTVTYDVWFKNLGEYVFHDEGTNSVTSSIVAGSGYTFYGMPFGGAVAGYNLGSYSFGAQVWDRQTTDESVTYSASGTFLADNGVTYQFSRQYSSGYWWELTRTSVAGAVPGASTDTVTESYAGDYRSEVTLSDSRDNLPATPFTTGGTTTFTAPATGSSYLESAFEEQHYSGTSKTTFVWLSDEQFASETQTFRSGYNGSAGYRYFFDGSATTGSRDAGATASEDRLTWHIDYQQQGDYTGNVDISRERVGGQGFSDKTKVTWANSGTVLADSYDLTDVYYRKNANGQVEGTYTLSRSLTAPLTYKNEQTLESAYDADVTTTVDKVKYSYERGGGTTVTVSDTGAGRFDIRGADGSQVGSAATGYFSTTTVTSGGSSKVTGEHDGMTKTGTIDSSGKWDGSTSSMYLNTAKYEAADGSVKWSATAFGLSSGTESGSSGMTGGYGADGNPTGGTARSQSQNSGSSLSWNWARRELKDSPTWATQSTLSVNGSGSGSVEVTFGSDGKADGSASSESTVTIDADVTTTLKGSFKLSDGGGTVNDYDHRHTHATSKADLDVTLTADLESGSFVTEDEVKVTYDYRIDRSIDKNEDKLHAKVEGSGKGKVESKDVVTDYLLLGSSTSTRVFTYSEQADNTSSTVANGKLTDAAGPTGTWNGKWSGGGWVDNKVTVQSSRQEDTNWQEESREFSVKQYRENASEFHQEDNGVGMLGVTAPGTTSYREHKVDSKSQARSYVSLSGTPSDYTYRRIYDAESGSREFTKGGWTNLAAGDWGHFTSETIGKARVEDSRLGRHSNNEDVDTQLRVNKVYENSGTSDSYNNSPNVQNDSHSRSYSKSTLFLSGSSSSGTGYRELRTNMRYWWSSLDKGTGRVSTGGDSAGQPDMVVWSDESWGSQVNPRPNPGLGQILWNDFSNDYAVLWLYNNGADLLRIGGGVMDVGLGAAMSLGSCGLGTIAGVGLMSVGIDQILTGAMNLGTGTRGMSVYEYGGYAGAQGLGFGEGTSQVIGSLTPTVLSLGLTGWWTACFVAGTPLLTPEGSRPIEQIREGDLVLSRSEYEPNGSVEVKMVEEVFVRSAPILNLHVGGRVIGTTAEHPFYVEGRGWLPCAELRIGDVLVSHDGRRLAVEGVADSGQVTTVYNMRIADFHTYFVGGDGWGFDVWAHNACNLNTNGATSRFGIYEIYVNGALYKVGKADLNRITQSSGLPTRLHQQIRKLEQLFGKGNVTQTVTDFGNTTTQLAKAAETAILRSIFDRLRIVPPGNIKSFFP